MQSAANLKPLNDLPPIIHGNSRSRANLLPSIGSSALINDTRNPMNDPIRALSSKNMSPVAGLGNRKQMDDDFYSQKTGL